MIIFRITKKKWLFDLTGIGAKLTGGRWNPKGYPVLYCASNSSLAILEKLVNVDFDLLPNDLYIAEIEIPNPDILQIPKDQLPENWDLYPSPDELKDFGKNWIDSNEHYVLEVPSAVNPHEVNYLLNVSHKNHSEIRIIATYPITLDDRLNK